MRWKPFSLGVVLMLTGAGLCAQAVPSSAPSTPTQVWTWDKVKELFELQNTTLMASRLNIDELKAQEITAHLRPNPDVTLSADGTQIAPSHDIMPRQAGPLRVPAKEQSNR